MFYCITRSDRPGARVCRSRLRNPAGIPVSWQDSILGKKNPGNSSNHSPSQHNKIILIQNTISRDKTVTYQTSSHKPLLNWSWIEAAVQLKCSYYPTAMCQIWKHKIRHYPTGSDTFAFAWSVLILWFSPELQKLLSGVLCTSTSMLTLA